MLVLLMVAVTGAWATEVTIATNQGQTSYTSGNITISVSNVGDGDGASVSSWWPMIITCGDGNVLQSVVVTIGYFPENASDVTASAGSCEVSGDGNKHSTYVTVTGINASSVSIGCNGDVQIEQVVVNYGPSAPEPEPQPAGYTVSMPQDTPDAEKWTARAGTDGTYQELPLEGVAQGAQVSLKYSGTKKVKSVKAVNFTKVTDFSELNTALSAGKNVKLMNDIVCTAVIEITSDGALTIDGNGKKLSTTSEIRAFQVGSSATVAFKNLTLTGFVNGGGPAILNSGGTIVLDGCTISNCHVNNSNGGGAIENKNNGKLYAINTTFSGNYSGEIGGAINNYNSSLYMSGCTFTNNYTTKSNAYYGGAIGINKGSEVRLINCAFSGNKYGTTTGTSDIGVYYKPTNYTIAGCIGAIIASNNGDITTNTSGTATLDYSDLSNISFTYNAYNAE